MPELREFMDRLKNTKREYLAVEDAVAHRLAAFREGKTARPTTTARDLDAAVNRLESTYIIRIWAEFETALRSYRRHVTRDRDDRIGTEHLIAWMAGVKQGRAIPANLQDEVHKLRNYRNFLVHETDNATPPVKIAINKGRNLLNTFLQKLPERWQSSS